jgi:23S rRNA pseudouridine2605 synthase
MSRTDNFQKFVKQKKSGTVKEELRQEKKKEKKERAAAIEAHFAKKRAERMQMQQPIGTVLKKARPNKYPVANKSDTTENKSSPTAGTKAASGKYPAKKTTERITTKAGEPVAGRADKHQVRGKAEHSESKTASAENKAGPKKYSSKKTSEEPAKKAEKVTVTPHKLSAKNNANSTDSRTVRTEKSSDAPKQPFKKTTEKVVKKEERTTGEQMPLNKYIAHGGICSRRDAAILVKEGKVTVNGTAATDPGMKIEPTDVVKVSNKKIIPSKNFVYILLNKPKDYITTSEDPQGRKTVLDLVRSATDERVYPVGRLDRNTSGVLLLTNDGDLAQKLSHPSHEVKKLYEVKLDRALTKGDLDKIASGITLEDGFVAPDVIAYADAKDKSVIGIEIHSGRNRIVRRIFEHLKYDVKGLDRVMFAGLTKKDVQRGRWRFLKEKEVRILKFMNQSFVKVKE